MQPYVRPQIARSIRRGTPPKVFELSEKQLETLKSVSEVVLAVGMVAGTLALTVLAPNIFQCLDKMPWARRTYRSRDTKLKDQQRKITKAIYYLKSRGLVELIPKGSDFVVKIKKKGRKRVRQMQFESLQVIPSKIWDKHWWLVIADVPKEYRRQADFFREKLKDMNFYHLQKTVWVFPFDFRDEVDFVSVYYRIERYVTTLEAVTLDPEDEIAVKRFFKAAKIL